MKVSRFVITGARDSRPSKEKALQVLRWADDIAEGAAELTHGCASGIDAYLSFLAEEELGWPIHYIEPDWKGKGKAAGPIRNKMMLEGKCECHPDLQYPVRMVLAFHDNLKRSKGTLDCITQAGQMRIPVLYWGYENVAGEVQPRLQDQVDTDTGSPGADDVASGDGGGDA